MKKKISIEKPSGTLDGDLWDEFDEDEEETTSSHDQIDEFNSLFEVQGTEELEIEPWNQDDLEEAENPLSSTSEEEDYQVTISQENFDF